MSFEFTDGWSFISIIVEHFENKVLEFRRQGLSTYLLPILLKFVVKNQVVKVLIFLCLLEWEDTLHNDE